jgi:hypothetical protein
VPNSIALRAEKRLSDINLALTQPLEDFYDQITSTVVSCSGAFSLISIKISNGKFNLIDFNTFSKRLYRGVRTEPEVIGNFPIVIAEPEPLTESGITRRHKRIIASGKADVYGRPIVYCDTYSSSRPSSDLTFVYARHQSKQREFLLKLDYFLENQRHNFPELADRSFECILNVDGEFVQTSSPLPFSLNLGVNPENIKFLRISIPFGDISIEFTTAARVSDDELAFARRRTLPRALESPLFGFDASHSSIWAPFLAQIHWAAGSIPYSTLENLIEFSATTPIPA